MRSEYVEKIERFFEDHQVREYRFEQRAKHVQVKGTFRGVPFCVTFPSTGSDWRGPLNAISDLRHAMGLVGAPANDNAGPAKVRRLKHRKAISRTMRKPLSPLIAEPVAFVDRFYAPLEIIRKRLAATVGTTQSVRVDFNQGDGSKSNDAAHGGDRIRLTTPWLGRRVRFTEI